MRGINRGSLSSGPASANGFEETILDIKRTIDCLPEIMAAVGERVPVLLDGGVRRGTDVFKALALGATGVGFGRPQVWGLAAFGQSGVEAVIDILNRELQQIMRQTGTDTGKHYARARCPFYLKLIDVERADLNERGANQQNTRRMAGCSKVIENLRGS